MLPSLIKDKKHCCHINGDSEKYHIIAEIMTLQSLLFRIRTIIYTEQLFTVPPKKVILHQKKSHVHFLKYL